MKRLLNHTDELQFPVRPAGGAVSLGPLWPSTSRAVQTLYTLTSVTRS